MKIGILQAGETPPEMRDKHGDYDDVFKRFLTNRGFEFQTFRVFDGDIPGGVDICDGWLITGSKFGVYEDHVWIPPFEDFLRRTYAAEVPIIGVCFGHQILAQALGGKVEKFSGGWSVGAETYTFENLEENPTIMAWHQDQVTQLPKDAKVIGRSDFCQNAMLAYGNRALTIQPHPEFTGEFMRDLLSAKREILPMQTAKTAEASINAKLDSPAIADQFEAFFKGEQHSE